MNSTVRERIMRHWREILVFVLGVYLILLASLWAVMFQPPEVFGKIMSELPAPVTFVLFPFKPMWMFARAGHLKRGDVAPDFSLETVGRKSRIQLSSFRGQRPVVLVFGSYT